MKNLQIYLVFLFFLTFILIGIKIFTVLIGLGDVFKITYIAVIACLPIVLFSKRRLEVIKNIDYHTLIFFTSMFVLMESVWNTGIFQNIVKDMDLTSTLTTLSLSVISSQFISNVPFVSLYLPLLNHTGTTIKQLMALSAGSTIAGNLFFLGAASNIIILQNAEKKGERISFWDFSKIGIPLTIINIFVYWIFFNGF